MEDVAVTVNVSITTKSDVRSILDLLFKLAVRNIKKIKKS